MGKVVIKGSDVTGVRLSPVDPKLMFGLGFCYLGPVKVDVPFTVYPLNPGWTVGLTVGIVMVFISDNDGKSESREERKEGLKEVTPPLTDKTPAH